MDGLQPYKRLDVGRDPRTHPLFLLHDLNRVDKHRHLSVTASVVPRGHVDVSVCGAPIVRYPFSSLHDRVIGWSTSAPLRTWRLEEDALLGVVLNLASNTANAPDDEVEVYFDLPVTVQIGELGPVNENVIPITDQLQALLNFVRKDVVPLFAPFF